LFKANTCFLLLFLLLQLLQYDPAADHCLPADLAGVDPSWSAVTSSIAFALNKPSSFSSSFSSSSYAA